MYFPEDLEDSPFLKKLHCGQVIIKKKKKWRKIFKKKFQGGQCPKNFRGGQRPKNFRGGQRPKIFGEDNVRKFVRGG